jgi:hypothetical protein
MPTAQPNLSFNKSMQLLTEIFRKAVRGIIQNDRVLG